MGTYLKKIKACLINVQMYDKDPIWDKNVV